MYEGTSVLMSRRPAGRYKRRLGPAREGLDFGLSVSAVGNFFSKIALSQKSVSCGVANDRVLRRGSRVLVRARVWGKPRALCKKQRHVR